MPLHDVSDVILDRDFLDSLVCERNPQTVSSGGIASVTPELIDFLGVVTNDKGDTLQRRDAGERVEGNITVHTTFDLQAGAPGETADIVQWNDRRYTVVGVNDYSRYGRGFVAATCELIPLSG
jgi:galactose-6-phosphate isomerase